MKVEDLIKEIKDNKFQILIFNDYDEDDESGEKANKFEKFHKFEILEHVCNSDEMYIVIFFKEYNIYLKLTGEYDSYGGGNHYYEGVISEVFPQTKTITVYNTKTN